MKNRYTPILVILLIFGFLLAFLLAGVGNQVKGKDVMDKNKATQVSQASPGDIARHYETAVFAAGCFWGVQEYFNRVQGVVKTEAGYTGGAVKNPTYEQVCSGATGHMEAVRVTYDPKVVSYERLLKHFWSIHDPISLDRQGNDRGSQYHAAIFYSIPKQETEARAYLNSMIKSGRYHKKIVTEVLPLREFYPAEEYHQNYLKKNPGGYCHIDLKKAVEK